MSLQMSKKTHHLVLIPGLDGTGQLFDPLLGVLPPEIETSVVSFPHDKTIYDHDLFAVIRNVIPWNRDLVVLGESTSGPIAMRFAAAQRENVKAVILASSFVSDPIQASSNWTTAFLSRPWYEKPASPTSVRKNLVGKAASDTLVDLTVRALRTPWPDVLGHRIDLARKVPARDQLQDWDRPILYLRAENDEFVPKSCVEEIVRLNPSVQVASIPGPHLILQANPRGSMEAIRDFLQDLSATGTVPHAA